MMPRAQTSVEPLNEQVAPLDRPLRTIVTAKHHAHRSGERSHPVNIEGSSANPIE
jgi:hypothetical protein